MVGDFFLTNWFLNGMRWVYSNVNSIFLTILIWTVFLRVLTLFSDIKTRKSSAGMARIQPQLQKLQKKYENDPQKLSIEQSKLMKKEGVSMFGSCLPLLITMPLFFCFIYAFRYWGYEAVIEMLVSEDPASVMEGYKFLWVNNIWQPDNGLSPVIQAASEFLNTKNLGNLLYLQENPEVWTKLCEIGVAAKHITFDATGNTVVNYRFLTSEAACAAYNRVLAPCIELYNGHNNGWFLLPVFSGLTGFLSSWIMMKGQPKSVNEAANQSTKMMTYMMPVMFFFFCLTSSAAFALYWTISSILMIIVNLAMNKMFPREIPEEEAK